MSFEGLDDVLKRLGKFEAEMEQQTKDIVSATALSIHGHAVKEIQRGKKSGRVYQRKNKTHQASATGEAPATDTGALVSSLQLRGAGRNSGEGLDPNSMAAFAQSSSGQTMHVFTRLNYAPFLEFGTSKMGERPFMRPALQANRAPFEKALKAMLDNVKRKLN